MHPLVAWIQLFSQTFGLPGTPNWLDQVNDNEQTGDSADCGAVRGSPLSEPYLPVQNARFM